MIPTALAAWRARRRPCTVVYVLPAVVFNLCQHEPCQDLAVFRVVAFGHNDVTDTQQCPEHTHQQVTGYRQRPHTEIIFTGTLADFADER